MKYKQKTILKIIPFVIASLFASNLFAQPGNEIVKEADSLFAQKRFTQSMELYQQALSQHQYSESMLLRMAFISEGLGHISQSLYYLHLYYLASHDKSALYKMEEVANQHRLQGYQPNQMRQVYFLLRSNYSLIAKILFGLSCLFFALLVYQKRKQKKPLLAAVLVLITMTLLFLHINFSEQINLGIVSKDTTYLMSGPSSGSSVVGIIGEGHLLDLLDKEDVWIHIKWMNQDAYIKEDNILKVEL